MEQKILDNELNVRVVLPISEENKGFMMTIANTFVTHGGTLRMYTKNEDEESLFVNTNEIAYHLLKVYMQDYFSLLEIDNTEEGFKILVLQSTGLN